MTDRFLPYGRQVIDSDDIAAVAAVLNGDFLTTGPVVEEFEQAFAKRVGSRYAVVCSSGTAALHLATLALGICKGDTAIVPTMTFLATANSVRYVGGDVLFADVDAATGLLTAENLEAALASATGHVKAVLPVHLAGQCVDMPAITRIAERHDLFVVEDACHALGSSSKDGGAVGSCRHSILTVFSFHPVKTIAMGEGGAITTNDQVLYDRLRRLRNHGIVREPELFQNADLAFGDNGEPNSWYYEMPELGFNYRASDIHCGLGLSQLGKLDGFISRRRELVAAYDRLLAPLAPIVRSPVRVAGCDPGWHLYAASIDFGRIGVSREQVMRRMKEKGVGTQVHYVPVHLQPYYQGLVGPQQMPGAMAYYRATLSLPLFPLMTASDVEHVVDVLQGAIAG
jgi:UDP-4-amino-4,6-dideoxy-N-acetyl-beta-L-altrosamine transaminase